MWTDYLFSQPVSSSHLIFRTTYNNLASVFSCYPRKGPVLAVHILEEDLVCKMSLRSAVPTKRLLRLISGQIYSYLTQNNVTANSNNKEHGHLQPLKTTLLKSSGRSFHLSILFFYIIV